MSRASSLACLPIDPRNRRGRYIPHFRPFRILYCCSYRVGAEDYWMHFAGMWLYLLSQGVYWYTTSIICPSSCYSDPEIRSNVFKSLILNTLSLTSIHAFDLLLQPLVRDQQKWFHRNFSWFYQILWLLPIVGASFYFNVRDFISNKLGCIADN